MHNIDIDIVDMALDVVKFAINRITETDPKLGFPKTEEELQELVGETITAKGIGEKRRSPFFVMFCSNQAFRLTIRGTWRLSPRRPPGLR